MALQPGPGRLVPPDLPRLRGVFAAAVTPVASLRLFALVCATVGVIPLANLLTSGTAVPWWNAAVEEWKLRGMVVLAVAVGLAFALPRQVDGALALGRAWLLRPTSRAFGLALAAGTLVAAALLAQFCFAGQPFTGDEMAQQWHARILLSGHLWATPELHREFFNTAPVFDRDGRWFSQYPIGSSALIAVGIALHAPWLVNPVLIAVGTWGLYRLLASAWDESTARLTTLLFASSPMVLIMAASQMNHVLALTLTIFALAALVAWDRVSDSAAQRRHAIAIGGALGLMTLVRPLDAVVVGIVIAAFQVWRTIPEPHRWRSIAIQLVVGAVPVAILLWVNSRTTGDPFVFAYEALNGPGQRLGFHLDPGGSMHTPRRGLVLVSGYLLRLNRYLFEWPIPGMLFVIAGLVAIRRPTRWDVVFVAVPAGFLAAYAAYWNDGFFAGPRFLFTATPMFVYFAARAPRVVPATASIAVVRRTVPLIVPICLLATWIGPLGASSARARTMLYAEQRTKLKTDIEAQIERAGLRNALVLVNEGWRGRLLARLRVLGITQFRAEHIVSSVDACALHTALDREDSLSAASDAERVDRVVRRARASGVAQPIPGLQADQVIAHTPGLAPTMACLRELQRDTAGTMPYPIFLARQHVTPDGRVGGDVVFARDLVDRNELLRNRFGERAWFRYRPAASLDDTSAAFIPYGRPR